MSTEKTNESRWVANLKQACIESLWLIVLLATLALIAVLGIQRLSSSKTNSTHSNIKVASSGSVSMQVTSAELALIVAKPIGELLTMQVYFDGKISAHGGGLLAKYNVEDVFQNRVPNKVLAYQQKKISISNLSISKQFSGIID